MANEMMKKISETYVAHLGSTIICVGTQAQCEKCVKDLPYVNSYKVHSIEDYGFECYTEGSDDGYQTGYDMGSE